MAHDVSLDLWIQLVDVLPKGAQRHVRKVREMAVLVLLFLTNINNLDAFAIFFGYFDGWLSGGGREGEGEEIR